MLNTTVYAPRTTLWAEANGSYYISESQSGSVREEFKVFYPRKGKTISTNGYYCGIEVDGYVFDNLNPTGV